MEKRSKRISAEYMFMKEKDSAVTLQSSSIMMEAIAFMKVLSAATWGKDHG